MSEIPLSSTSFDPAFEKDGHNFIRDALLGDDRAALRLLLTDQHPADCSDQFEQLTPDQRQQVIQQAGDLISGEILAEMEDEVVENILPKLPAVHIAAAISEIDNDDAIQIVEEMEAGQRQEVLDALNPTPRAAVEAGLRFGDETAGRLMQREFVAAPEFWTVGNTIDHMRGTGANLPDLFFNIYIVDASFKPIGYVPVSHLMRHPRSDTLGVIMTSDLVSVPQDMDQEDIAHIFEKYNLISAPVVDDAERLVGMMTVDDIIEIIQNENKEDMLAMAGVSDAGLTDTPLSTVRARVPWLFVNLITAVLASLVIAQFETVISQYIALAILMPIVASMGGNAGTQALAVAVRGLAERDLTSQSAWRAIRREGLAAIVIGLIFAVVLAGITFIWFGDQHLAFVVFLAMIANHICAGLAGIIIPLTLRHVGADPAVSSSVFVTTVTDVIGFFAFLGLAAYLLF